MPKQLKFEDYRKIVEEVVEKLESGRLGLEESLEEYEKGINAVKECYKILNACEQRIKVLAMERDKVIDQKDFDNK